MLMFFDVQGQETTGVSEEATLDRLLRENADLKRKNADLWQALRVLRESGAASRPNTASATISALTAATGESRAAVAC